MKKDAFYFPHDSNAHQDPKLLSLRAECGYEGIGLFWTFVEILRESSGYKYPYKMPMISLALGHPQATLEAWLKQCLEIGLFVEVEGSLSSPALTIRMELIDRRREILRQSGRRGYEAKSSKAQATLKPPLSLAQASKVKESKVEKSKEEERKEETTKTRFEKPTAVDVSQYAETLSFKLDGEAFIDYYASKGWLIGKSPMRDWRAAVRNWKKRRIDDGQSGKGAAVVAGKYDHLE